MGQDFWKIKNPAIFPVLNLFKFFKVGEIIMSKYEHLMIPRVFSDNVMPDIDFTDEAVIQRNVPVVETSL